MVISVYVLIAASDAVGRLPAAGACRNGCAVRWCCPPFCWRSVAGRRRRWSPPPNRSARACRNIRRTSRRWSLQLVAIAGVKGAPTGTAFEEDLRHPASRRSRHRPWLDQRGGGLIFMVVIYTVFLMGERNGFAHKVAVALPGESGARSLIITETNRAISDYLAVKTLVNVILACCPYAVLWGSASISALFWGPS